MHKDIFQKMQSISHEYLSLFDILNIKNESKLCKLAISKRISRHV